MSLLYGYATFPLSLSFQTVMSSCVGSLVQNSYNLNSLGIDLNGVAGTEETTDTYTEKLALGVLCTNSTLPTATWKHSLFVL